MCRIVRGCGDDCGSSTTLLRRLVDRDLLSFQKPGVFKHVAKVVKGHMLEVFAALNGSVLLRVITFYRHFNFECGIQARRKLLSSRFDFAAADSISTSEFGSNLLFVPLSFASFGCSDSGRKFV